MNTLALASALLVSLAQVPSPSLTVTPAEAKPGDAVLLELSGVDADAVPVASFAGRPVLFFPRDGKKLALVGLPVETTPGPLAIEVKLGEGAPLTAELQVRDPQFPAKELKVNDKFVAPPPEVQARIEEDKAAFAAALAQTFEGPLFSRPFAWPRKAVITAPFGDRRTFNGNTQSQHYGIDLDGKTGSPIVAANDGTVVLIRDCYTSGNTVIVHHGAGLYSLYFHLSKFLVKEGAKVKRGQRLGLVGRTGRVTGPHLHWSMKVGDLYVDPASILRLPLAKGDEGSRKAP